MPIHYDIKKDGLYNLGLKEGREEAEKRAKKIQQKLEIEAKKRQENGIKNLLDLGILTDKQIAESLDVSTYLVRKIKKQMKNEKDS